MNTTIQLHEVDGFDASGFDRIVINGAAHVFAMLVYEKRASDDGARGGGASPPRSLTILAPNSEDPTVRARVKAALLPTTDADRWLI